MPVKKIKTKSRSKKEKKKVVAKKATVRKKTVGKKKVVAKKKVVKKAKATKKVAVKKVGKKKTARKEPVVLGLSKKELEKLIITKEHVNSAKSEKKVSEAQHIYQEKIRVIIKSERERTVHSPYVLDLDAMTEKKRIKKEKERKKKEIFSLLGNRDVADRGSPLGRELEAERRIAELSIEADNRNASLHRSLPSDDFGRDDKVEIGMTSGFGGLENKDEETEVEVIQHEVVVEKSGDQFTKKPFYYHWNLPLNWHRAMVVYFVIAMMVILPIKVFGYYTDLTQTKSQVMEYANKAYDDLKIAGESLAKQDISSAKTGFNSANYNFNKASEELDEINIALKTLINLVPTGEANIADAEYLLEIGKTTTELGAELSNIFNKFKQGEDLKLTDKIAILQTDLASLIEKLQKINITLGKINISAIPEDKQSVFTKAKDTLGNITNDLVELSNLSDTLQDVLGKDLDRTYLFVFQNNNEIRATGGFMGSFSIVDVNQGEIKRMATPGGGTYDMQGGLLVNTLPPTPLKLINYKWEMQDSNWFPDFPTSAKKIKWFYEKSGGETVDGVIALNVGIMPKLLEITGDIEMPEYGTTLTAGNFVDTIQAHVEYGYDKETNKPKQILADMAPRFIEKLFSSSDPLMIAKVLKVSMDNKDIQMYFRKEEVQEKFSSFDWTGEVKNTTRDFLSVINTNIGGGKTDSVIEQKVNLISDVDENGEIINTLTITRTHTGDENDIFEKTINSNFLRAYVPQGSQLILAEGFDSVPEKIIAMADADLVKDEYLASIEGQVWIDPENGTQINNEFNKTVFGNWIILEPGESKTVILKYKIPTKLELSKLNNTSMINFFDDKDSGVYHSLYIQKQSGAQNVSYSASVNFPTNRTVVPVYMNQAEISNNIVEIESDDNRDSFTAIVVK